jgi:hypothetical protein
MLEDRPFRTLQDKPLRDGWGGVVRTNRASVSTSSPQACDCGPAKGSQRSDRSDHRHDTEQCAASQRRPAQPGWQRYKIHRPRWTHSRGFPSCRGEHSYRRLRHWNRHHGGPNASNFRGFHSARSGATRRSGRRPLHCAPGHRPIRVSRRYQLSTVTRDAIFDLRTKSRECSNATASS